ncbi:alpha/beta fold hydrolase [Lysobacter sp. TY2-98]|uniref:esterase/lipase family protein n=1 Tax=Lysobacter sp. TY2-98 TaxID=2290922 RepID=UPI000E20987B|nr:alpha/beta fold hydrolase [Lysobacter sp. TY2-98]AXK71013.1 alpha/beta fold hydrolase [Lysobacter sp. TY2-98]
MTTSRVLLVHGLWMRPASMAMLARRLAHQGFDVDFIGYASTRDSPAHAVERLATAAAKSPCHVVGHSLGGLVTLTALEAEPELPVERVVCLGSPLCGSAAATGMARLPGLRRWLGHSHGLLRDGCRPWRGRAAVGSIAGTLPLGLGRVVGRLRGPNDGTVAVSETRLEGLADHLVVRATHSGLVLSPTAARQTAAFLRDGHFEH